MARHTGHGHFSFSLVFLPCFYFSSILLQGLDFPLSHLPALQQLLSGERLRVVELPLQQDADKLGLVLGLWTEGLLRVC